MIEIIDEPEFVIEKGIPTPPRYVPKGQKRSALRVALAAMEIGDSVLIKNKTLNALTTMVHNTLGKSNYAIRKDSEGHRVWRLK